MIVVSLICLTLAFIKGSHGQIVVTQTPSSFQANPGDTVTIQCKASSSVSAYMNLYQFKPGQNPKLLIYKASNRFGGTPDRFSGRGSSTSYSFTINGVRPEDEGEYYCGQHYSRPYTFGAGTKVQIKSNLIYAGRDEARPSALIFPPSKEQLKTNFATLVCLIDNFYPSEVRVVWKVDGRATTREMQKSAAAKNTDQTYRLSSTLTLPVEEYNSHESYACEVTHKTLSEPLVKSFKRSECSG